MWTLTQEHIIKNKWRNILPFRKKLHSDGDYHYVTYDILFLATPNGPQTSVPETNVTNHGWTICHTELYDVALTDDSIATIQVCTSSCNPKI